jgi:RNA polymerase sigma factor (sigma-70 family)
VKARTPLKKAWVLTREAFDGLLARLDADSGRAGEKYEQIRHALITFFECRGSAAPEDHADETINRVARRLSEGASITTDTPASYFYGVARNVLRESWDAQGRATRLESVHAAGLSTDDPAVAERHADEARHEQQLACLRQCVQALDPKQRALIGSYYQGETSDKIRARKALASELGIPAATLRLRALRIREKLEMCVERCMEGAVP